MVTKKDQRYIVEIVRDEKVAEKIVDYLNIHKKEVGPEALFTSNGKTKTIFRSLFQDSWKPEDFLRHLPFFYDTVSRDEIDENDDNPMFYDDEHMISFEGILEEYCDPIAGPDNGDIYGEDDNYEDPYPSLEDLSKRMLALFDKTVLNHEISCHEFLKWLFTEHFHNYQNDWMFNVVLRFEEYLNLCEEVNRTISLPKDLTVSLNILKEELFLLLIHL